MASSILNEKKLLLAEWRDERSRKGVGGDVDTAADELDIISNKGPNSSKFTEAALAENRQKVEQWKQQKAAQRQQIEVRRITRDKRFQSCNICFWYCREMRRNGGKRKLLEGKKRFS